MKIVDNNLLTEREKEIVLHIINGETKGEIAQSLFLSISTIKTNVENIYRKLNVNNKAALIVYVVKKNMLIFDKE